MPSALRRLLDLLKEAAVGWLDDEAPRLSAALAYYTIFSIAPLLIIVLAVVSIAWGNQPGAVRADLLAQLRGTLGPEGASMIQTMLDNTSRPGSGGILATVLGTIALLFGATGVFNQLQAALNSIWNVPDASGGGVMGFLTQRAWSFVMVLGIGALLLLSLLLSTAVAALNQVLTDLSPALNLLAYTLNLLLSLALFTGLFALMYRVLPDVEIAWRNVLVGAAITAVLFTLGKTVISVYLSSSGVGSAYGAAGSLVVLLLWIYYSTLIFFFGAEVTQVYARRYGSKIRPEGAAEKDEDVKPRPTMPARTTRPSESRFPAGAVVGIAAAFLLGRWLGKGS
ncbi:MAG: YihY family inner membrane protein [Bacteroidetes bacterium]|jgi:membrane protein|nr:YihY family inner membrane protein [Bacteroidota bacterium]